MATIVVFCVTRLVWVVLLVLAGGFGFAEPNKPIVLYEIKSGLVPVPVVLHSDFGVMLVNDPSGEKPVSRYILGSKKSGRVFSTLSLAEFEKALRAIPPGTIVPTYDSCTVSRSSTPQRFRRMSRQSFSVKRTPIRAC